MPYLFVQQKIPRRMVRDGMHDSGNITIVCHPYRKIQTTYAISLDDGRLLVNGWKEFMEKEDNLRIGHTTLFMLYHGKKGLFLFAEYIRCLDVE